MPSGLDWLQSHAFLFGNGLRGTEGAISIKFMKKFLLAAAVFSVILTLCSCGKRDGVADGNGTNAADESPVPSDDRQENQGGGTVIEDWEPG